MTSTKSDKTNSTTDEAWHPGVGWSLLFREGIRLFCVVLGLTTTRMVFHQHQLMAQIIGVLVGYLVGRPVGVGAKALSRLAGRQVQHTTSPNLVIGVVAAVAGVVLTYVVTFPLRDHTLISRSVGYSICGLLMWTVGGLAWLIGRGYTDAILGSLGVSIRPIIKSEVRGLEAGVLLDTSVILDGLLLQLARSNLLPPDLLIPVFVLDEVQGWADSPDGPKSRKAKNGLEQLRAIRETGLRKVVIMHDLIPEVDRVDAKIIALSRRLDLSIATTDRALANTAALEGSRVLNLRGLVEQLATNHQSGDTVPVALVKTGQQEGQAVGYLPDGSMVVVEEAAAMIDRGPVEVELVHSLSTNKGHLYFGRLADAPPVPGTIQSPRDPLAESGVQSNGSETVPDIDIQSPQEPLEEPGVQSNSSETVPTLNEDHGITLT